MKKIFLTLLTTGAMSLFSNAAMAICGPNDYNYILKKTYIAAASADSVMDRSYYDGLGYNLLDVSYGAGGTGRSLCTPYVLDPMRRTDTKEFLPIYFEGLSDNQLTPGYITPSSHGTAYMLYLNDSRPYSETRYGTSPVGKPESIQKPGGVFQTAGKRSTITRRVPDPQQEDIWGIDYDRTSTLSYINFNVYQFMWAQGDLLCECTVDEDGEKTEVFTDRFGKTILERKWNGTEKLDTYYVYDLKDQLVCVIQPEGGKDVWLYSAASFTAEDNIAKNYCFLYVYDDDGTVIRKRVPGGCWQDYIYDERQRLLLYTDERLLENDAYIRYRYDNKDRVTSEILISASTLSNPDPANIRSDILYGAAGEMFQCMPVIQTLRECKYWGDNGYTTLQQGGVPSNIGATFLKGLLAQEKVWEAPSANGAAAQNPLCTTRKFAYDYRGRLIYTYETDNLGWSKTVNTSYDFTGNITSRTESIAKVGGMTTNTNSEQWTYDNRGRVLTYSHSYNNALKASVSYQYDEFGRLKKKVYDNGKAEESFTWNLQGWNTGKQAKWGNNLIFSEDLKYYNPVKDTTLALYSGNISEAATKQQTGQLATNSYSYDGVGRLTNALLLLGDSQNPVTYNGMRNIQYDRNGNMTSNQTIDMGFNKLQTFSHNGNRLTSLLETFPQSTRPSSNSTFSYDSRGNMTSDGRKGLLISYNILNLPEKVVKADSTDMATFRYLYDGTKVAAVRSNGTSIRYQGAFVIDCSATGFPSTIKSIAWADGVCAAKDGGSGYGDYLNVKDHLGNVRDIVALYSASTTPVANAIVEKSDYLPFGQRISDITSQYASNQFSGTSSTHRWHLGTKEEVSEGGLNLLDFGARYYDPVLCRWTAVDPMAEKYYVVSPYCYCGNNPIISIDINGLYLDDYYSYETGQYLGSDAYGTNSRLISREDYVKYTNGKQLTKSLSVSTDLRSASKAISIDEAKINADVSDMTAMSYSEGVEHQIYIVLDMDSATITSIAGPTGKNHRADINGIASASMPSTYFCDESKGTILIGEVHGHPQSNSGETLSMTSSDDYDSAKKFGIPIYAVDAMDISSTGNKIHRVTPSGHAVSNIGRTIGDNSSGYSFGAESLKIWGQFHYSGNPYIPYPKQIR